MSNEWNIKSRGDKCAACESEFEDDQKFATALTFGEEGYLRQDFCTDCWNKQDNQDEYVSSWLGVFRSPPPKPEDPLKQENAEVLLREMMEKPDPDKANMMYILAIMLERKKIFVEQDVQVGPDGQRIILYEHKHSGEAFTVIDPQLKLTELIPVQEEVVVMLGGTPPTHKVAAKAAEAEEGSSEVAEDDEEFDDDDDEFDEDD